MYIKQLSIRKGGERNGAGSWRDAEKEGEGRKCTGYMLGAAGVESAERFMNGLRVKRYPHFRYSVPSYSVNIFNFFYPPA